MWVDEFDICVEFRELCEINRTVLVTPVVYERTTFCHGGDETEKRQVVHVDARKWHAVELVFWCDKLRVFEVDIDKASEAVVCGVFFAEFVLQAHASEDGKFDFEELNRRALDCDFGISDCCCGNEAHSFDRVFAREVLDILIDRFAACDAQSGRADTFYFDTEFLQEEAEVLHHVVRTCIANRDGTVVASSCHEDVLCDCITTFGEKDCLVDFVR